MTYQQSLFLPSQFSLFTFNNSTTNFTTNNSHGLIVGWGYFYNGTSPANGDYIDYAVGTITPGIYRVEYPLLNNTDIAIIDFSYKANGAGSYTNIRSGINCYANAGNPYTLIYTDYFLIKTAGTLNLRWTVNGTGGSSYIVYLGIAGAVVSAMSGISIVRVG